MSLAQFLKYKDVKAKLKPLRPEDLPRKIERPLQVEPKTDRLAIVGMAFDYLLRFELQRRVPHAVTVPWMVEQVPDRIWKETSSGCGGGMDVLAHAFPGFPFAPPYPKGYLPPEEVQKRAKKIVEDAKAAVLAYLKLRRPNRAIREALAAHAIRLAKLECLNHSGKLDPRFEEADSKDVEDLLSLLDVVPFKLLLHDKILRLNPPLPCVWGESRADLITGDMLVDFKTTKKGEMDVANLDQLFGYYLLARRHRQVDPTFPEINRLAFYFSRHGYLWSEPATTWTNHPKFSDIEKWFFQRAEEIYDCPRKSGRSVRKPSV
jgi:hypothetical protein